MAYLPALNKPVTIDTNDLPTEEANELERLVEAAGFFELPGTSAPPRGAADFHRYTLSVTAPDRSHTVRLTDPIENPHVRELVNYLRGTQTRDAP